MTSRTGEVDQGATSLARVGWCNGGGGFEAWRELCRPIYDLQPIEAAGPFTARWSLRSLGRMVFTDVTFGAHALTHDPARLERYDQNFLLLEFYLQGRGHGIVAEAPTRIDEGRIHLIDFSKPYRTVTGRVRTRGVLIPHHVVGYDPARHSPYTSIPISTPAGRVLSVAFRTLFEEIAKPDSATAARLTAAAAALVKELLLRAPDGAKSAAASASDDLVADCQDDAIRTYIEAHIDDPDLSVERLCQTFHVSRATLYRRFSDVGGISGLIKTRRLERCRAELEASSPDHSTVRAVAERWGFFDASGFSRAFKRRFGVAPSEARDAAFCGHAQHTRPGSSLHDWLLRSETSGPMQARRP